MQLWNLRFTVITPEYRKGTNSLCFYSSSLVEKYKVIVMCEGETLFDYVISKKDVGDERVWRRGSGAEVCSWLALPSYMRRTAEWRW